MNDALEVYRNEPKVGHIQAHNFTNDNTLPDTFLIKWTGSWGWATWKKKWNYFTHYQTRQEALQGLSDNDIKKLEYNGNFTCLKSLDKNPIPWDICWEISIYKQGGLCLHPTHTLIKNVGISNGTHFSASKLFGWYDYDRPFKTKSITLKDIPIEENPNIEKMYEKAMKDHGMRYNFFGKIVRYFYKLIIK